MKKKYLALIVFLAVALAVTALGWSLGWFPTFGSGGEDPFKSQLIGNGDMEYTLVGGCEIRPAFSDEINSVDYAAPGENMIYVKNTENEWVPGALTINNKSTIATNLRVKIEYSWWNTTTLALETVVYGDKTDDFTVGFGAGWVYNNTSKFWDYSPGGSAVIPAVNLVLTPGGTDILINSMGYSDAIGVGSAYETKEVTVKLKVEAKQANYVEWVTVSTLTP